MTPSPRRSSFVVRRSAFTLIELLVAITIIIILVAILLPVASNIQKSARAAATQSLISQLQSSCEAYYQVFHAYPGPFDNSQINTFKYAGAGTVIPPALFQPTASGTPATTAWTQGTGAGQLANNQITGAENLAVGLLGGLRRDPTNGNIVYDPDAIGTGVYSLGTGPVKSYGSFFNANNLYKSNPRSLFTDEAATASDSQIPEFVDTFPNPMPILYLRASGGRTIVASLNTNVGAYDLNQVEGYTTSNIGVGKNGVDYYGTKTMGVNSSSASPTSIKNLGTAPYHGLQNVRSNDPVTDGTMNPALRLNEASATAPYFYPLPGFPYLQNPSLPGVPRAKDAYILISAGKDRVYGTEDDITSFGSVAP